MSNKISCVILGAGGHARVLIDCLQFYPDVIISCILDSSISLSGRIIHGIPVLGNDDLLSGIRETGTSHFVVGLGGTGNNLPRKRLFESGLAFGLIPLTVKHPSAIISLTAEHGQGCQFLPGCIVNTGAVLGSNVIVNSGSVIEHDCVLADHVHVATGARLAGAVRVGKAAHIGVGATIRQNIVVGESAVVGAGAVVVNEVQPETTVIGVPANIYKGKVI